MANTCPGFVLCPEPIVRAQESPPHFAGGVPQCPDAMAWPQDQQWGELSFLMQFDLGTLPRTVHDGKKQVALPDFPEHGTLYVFFEGANDADSTPGLHLRYTPERGENLKPRYPKFSAPNLAEANPHFVKKSALHFSRQSMREFRLEPLPCAFPILKGFSQSAMDEWEKARMAALKSVLRQVKTPNAPLYRFPWLPSTSARLEGQPAQNLFDIPDSFPWRWDLIHEIALCFQRLAPRARNGFNLTRSFWPHLDELCQAWIKACAFQLSKPVPPEKAESFRRWLLSMDTAWQHMRTVDRLTSSDIAKAEALVEAYEDVLYESKGFEPDLLDALYAVEDAVMISEVVLLFRTGLRLC